MTHMNTDDDVAVRIGGRDSEWYPGKHVETLAQRISAPNASADDSKEGRDSEWYPGKNVKALAQRVSSAHGSADASTDDLPDASSLAATSDLISRGVVMLRSVLSGMYLHVPDKEQGDGKPIWQFHSKSAGSQWQVEAPPGGKEGMVQRPQHERGLLT